MTDWPHHSIRRRRRRKGEVKLADIGHRLQGSSAVLAFRNVRNSSQTFAYFTGVKAAIYLAIRQRFLAAVANPQGD